jgi:hypothetical protein
VAADVLSKLGSRRALVPAGVFVQDLREPLIKILDPDSPDPPQHDQAPTPPHDVLLTVKFRQPSHEFTFGVGITFISYPLVLTPLV